MLWEKSDIVNKVIVVSDLHFGKSDTYAQNVTNKVPFSQFVDKLIEVGDVAELVIAGDFLDEWIIPLSCPPHDNSSQHYRDCLANNKVVVDALNRAMDAGIKVVYVIGNHDMTLEAEVLQEAMPKLVQARDARGLGVYYTGVRNEIAIEHSHRYEAYSAPDTVTNRELAGNDDTILPPGYFYARLGTQWVIEGQPTVKVSYPVIDEAPQSDDLDQMGAYLHYKVMTEMLLSKFTPRVEFDEKVFDMKIGGLNGKYSEKDLCPCKQASGRISAPVLYPDFQRTWRERMRVNRVAVPMSFIEAVKGASEIPYFRRQASVQYLDRPETGIDVVVFGHTHVPDFHDYGNGRYYLNDGTWIDSNLDGDYTCTFALIASGDVDTARILRYCEDGSIEDISNHATGATG